MLPDSAEDELFRGRGWVLESHDADTLFQIARCRGRARGVEAAALAPRTDRGRTTRTGDLVDRAGSATRASGVAAYGDDWVGFRSIEVDPASTGARASGSR